jgi:lysozyme
METSYELLARLIKEFEGCKLHSYLCPAGVWTIGYGVTGKDIIKGTVWTQEQADNALDRLVKDRVLQAITASPILKSQSPGKIAAIADFIYNCGLGNYNSSTLKTKVDAARWVEAVNEIHRWNKGGGKVLSGLVRRRSAEAVLLAGLASINK